MDGERPQAVSELIEVNREYFDQFAQNIAAAVHPGDYDRLGSPPLGTGRVSAGEDV